MTNWSPNFGNAGDFISDPFGNLSGVFQDFGGWFTGQTQFEASTDFQKEMFEKNAALQRQFAQMGIQWRVNDAKKAGLHPLAALGAHTPSGSPIAVGTPETGGGISPNAVMGVIADLISSRGLKDAQARYYNALADKEIAGQADTVADTPGHAVAGGGMSGSKAYQYSGAGTQVDYGLVEDPHGGLVVGQGKDVQGPDEDPGGTLRRFQHWNYIRTRSNEFVDMDKRKGVPWDRYKKAVMSTHPQKDPGKDRMWQWNVQSKKWQSVPNGNPKFQETSGLKSPAPIQTQMLEVLKDVINEAASKIPNPQRAYPAVEGGRGRGHYPEGQPGYKRRGMWERRK